MQGKRIIRGVILVLAAMFTIALSSCDYVNKYTSRDSVDSTFVADYVNNYTNPQMLSVDEVWTLKSLIAGKMSVDNTFVNMSDDVIENVATVLLKRQPEGISKLDIVTEYLSNRNIYDNLPDVNTTNSNPAIEVDKTGTDLGNRSDEDNIEFRVDTIDDGTTVVYKVQKK